MATQTCGLCKLPVTLGKDRWIVLLVDGRRRTVHAECAAKQPEQTAIEAA